MPSDEQFFTNVFTNAQLTPPPQGEPLVGVFSRRLPKVGYVFIIIFFMLLYFWGGVHMRVFFSTPVFHFFMAKVENPAFAGELNHIVSSRRFIPAPPTRAVCMRKCMSCDSPPSVLPCLSLHSLLTPEPFKTRSVCGFLLCSKPSWTSGRVSETGGGSE